MDSFEEKILELKRRGDAEKVNLLQALNKKVLPSQLQRIQQNDKTVMQELFLPKWLTWGLLRDWAVRQSKQSKGRKCILCSENNEVGIDFNEKFICENCFVRLKNL